jgi:hypothetical protein
MWPGWPAGPISFVRDYRYVRYVVDDAELVLAPNAALRTEGTANGWPPGGFWPARRTIEARNLFLDRAC